MFDKLNDVRARYSELESQLGDPAIAGNPLEYQKIAREHGKLQALVFSLDRYDSIERQVVENKELLTHENDPEMRQLLREEVSQLEEEYEELRLHIRLMLVPKDPLDEKNVFLEIRAGTGGEEAALFAARLFRMYKRYAERVGWKLDLISENETEIGGYREVIVLIEGDDVYSKLKYEAGTHRVQRVPETETQGRIHTSAATVAVLPEADDVEVNIQTNDIRIDTYRASGAGGQHVNRTDSAIRITHLPTGLVVTCQDEKSQHKNKAKAMKVLQSKLFEMQREEIHAAEASERKTQVGSGDRSERIRTYNFPQSRITDHRINFTTHRMEQVLDGMLEELIEPLQTNEQAEKLQGLEE